MHCMHLMEYLQKELRVFRGYIGPLMRLKNEKKVFHKFLFINILGKYPKCKSLVLI